MPIGTTGPLLKTHSKRWNDSFSGTPGAQIYHDVPGASLTFNISTSNPTLLLTSNIRIYGDSGTNSNGWNTAFKVNNILVGGTEGSSGDTWTRFGHSHFGSFILYRQMPYVFTGNAGNTVTVKCVWGYWAQGGIRYINYAGYNIYSEMTVYEFQSS